MKTHTQSRLLLLIALMSGPVAFAVEKSAAVTYSEAVVIYVDAAAGQLRAIRESVDATTENSSDDVRKLYADVYKRLDQCDDFVRRLKVAPPRDFDAIKAEFERVRGEMVKALETARRAI